MAAQSVLLARLSASATSFCLMTRASDWAESSWAKYVRRALSKLFRAALKRCQRLASESLSIRTPPRCSAFHSSSSSRIRAPLAFHWIRSGSCAEIASAAVTIAVRRSFAASLAAARSAASSPRRLSTTAAIAATFSSSVVESLEEQVSAGQQIVILADEVADRILWPGTGVGAHGPLPVTVSDIDDTVLVHSPEGPGGRGTMALRKDRRRRHRGT